MFTISQRPHLRFFAPEAEPGGDPAPVTDPAPAPVDPPADPAPADPQPTDPPADPTGEPETFSKDYVEKLRREAAGYREKAKTDAAAAAEAAKTELAQSIGKALGLVKDDEPVTVETLTTEVGERDQTITQQGTEIKSLKVENALLRTAGKFDADLDALLDSNAFTSKANALDPTADDFASQVDALIKDTVDGNPSKFKRVQVAASSGGAQHTGEPATRATEEKTIDELRKERQKRRGIQV